MSLIRLQRFVWFPLQRQHLAASLLCALAMVALGAFGFAGFPAFKPYSDIRAPAAQLLEFDIVLVVANYLFIVRQGLGSYLRLRQVFLPALASLVILSAVAFAVTSVLKPPPAPPTGSAAALMPVPAAAAPETPEEALLKRLLIAEGGLAALILTAALWKNDDEAIASLAGSLRRIRELHAGIRSGITDLAEARRVKRALLFHLDAVDSWIGSNEYAAAVEQLDQLKTACGDAATEIAEIDVGAFLVTQSKPRERILALLDPIVRFG